MFPGSSHITKLTLQRTNMSQNTHQNSTLRPLRLQFTAKPSKLWFFSPSCVSHILNDPWTPFGQVLKIVLQRHTYCAQIVCARVCAGQTCSIVVMRFGIWEKSVGVLKVCSCSAHFVQFLWFRGYGIISLSLSCTWGNLYLDRFNCTHIHTHKDEPTIKTAKHNLIIYWFCFASGLFFTNQWLRLGSDTADGGIY